MQDVLDRLFARRTFGVKLGLDTELALLDALENPHESLAVVHVAGTNGKGSVCAMLESVCRVAGLKTGLYTSPHLVRFHERFRVSGEAIADDALASLLARVEAACDRVVADTGVEPTFFEAATAMAFCHFRDQQTDVVMVETGLGGRLDATNVVRPLLSVITRIAVDHTRHLGDSIEVIAGEKCGIIKHGRPVVCGAQEDEARMVVARSAAAKGCACIHVDESAVVHVKARSWAGQKCTLETAEGAYGSMTLPLPGNHQLENLASAVCAAEQLAAIGLPLSDSAVIKRGVESVAWPGRCQVLQTDPLVLLDGAHNLSAMRALGHTIKSLAKNTPLALICGFCEDKDIQGCLGYIPDTLRQAWAVPVSSERSMSNDALCTIIENRGISCNAVSLHDAWEEAQSWASGCGAVIVICGSLFLAGEVLECIETGRLSLRA